MERAGRTLAKLKTANKIPVDELACAAWPAAVGKRIAERTRAVSLVRDKLVVEVEDAIWQRQLFSLRGQIIHKIHEVLGDATVNDVEFRIVPPRRPPQTATRLGTGAGADEAEGIQDPVMRLVYRQARKKANG